MATKNVGGQALIEGVLMRGEDKIAIVVRRKDGTLLKKDEKIEPAKSRIFKLPLLRGIYALYQSMKIGINALNLSAQEFNQGEKDKFDLWLEKVFGDKSDKISIGISMIISLFMTILFFVFLPTLFASFLKKMTTNAFLLSFFEGMFKMGLFLIYLILIRRMKEIRRVFEYHGAEHKAVFNYESGLELSVENARKFSTLHPRCGTSFVFFVLAISILVSSFVSWADPVLRVVIKILLLPVVAALGYETLRFSSSSTNPLVKLLVKPGLMIQKITTKEPDDKQLEVAVEALKMVI